MSDDDRWKVSSINWSREEWPYYDVIAEYVAATWRAAGLYDRELPHRSRMHAAYRAKTRRRNRRRR